MNKKSMFFFSLLAGGTASAYLLLKKMNSTQRKQILHRVNDKAVHLKHRAVDYAFYANDAMDNAKHNLHHKTGQAKSMFDSVSNDAGNLKNKFNSKLHKSSKNDQTQNTTQFHTAADHLRSELDNNDHNNDIMINANDAFNDDKDHHNNKTITYYPDGSVK